MGSEYNDEGVEQGIAQDLPEGSYVTVPALSLRQVPQLRSWKLTTRSSAAQWGPSLLAVAYKTPSTSVSGFGYFIDCNQPNSAFHELQSLE